jgi:hypothetical protein
MWAFVNGKQYFVPSSAITANINYLMSEPIISVTNQAQKLILQKLN